MDDGNDDRGAAVLVVSGLILEEVNVGEASDRSGPSKANSRCFCEGWDRIFGTRREEELPN